MDARCTRRRHWIAGIMIAVLCVGCAGGSDSAEATEYSSNRALADAVSCTGFEERRDDFVQTELATCELDGSAISIVVLPTPDDRIAMEQMMAALLCSADPPRAYVAGANWLVFPDEGGVADLQRSLGEGDVETPDC